MRWTTGQSSRESGKAVCASLCLACLNSLQSRPRWHRRQDLICFKVKCFASYTVLFFPFSSLGRHEDSFHFPAIANNTVSKRMPYTTGVPHSHSVTSNSLGGQVSPMETLICIVQLNIYVTFVFSFLEHRSLSAKGIFLTTAYLLLLIWNSAWKTRIACITLLEQAK